MNNDLYFYKAEVFNVVDGDTIDVAIDLGFKSFVHHRFRLYGINTPELRSKNPEEREKAKEAKSFLEKTLLPYPGMSIVRSQTYIRTFKDKQEKYGRYLAIIYLEHFDNPNVLVNVNNLLVEKGLAVRYEE